MPTVMFLAPLVLMIFLPAISSASNSAAVGAATPTPAGAAAAPSAGLGAASPGGAPSACAGGFFEPFAGCASPAGFAAGFSRAASGFLCAGFFFSSCVLVIGLIRLVRLILYR